MKWTTPLDQPTETGSIFQNIRQSLHTTTSIRRKIPKVFAFNRQHLAKLIILKW